MPNQITNDTITMFFGVLNPTSGTGLYINTGDWLFHKTYVEWDGEEFRLLSFAGDGLADENPRGE